MENNEILKTEEKYTMNEVLKAIELLSEDEKTCLLSNYKVTDIHALMNDTSALKCWCDDVMKHVYAISLITQGLNKIFIALNKKGCVTSEDMCLSRNILNEVKDILRFLNPTERRLNNLKKYVETGNQNQ